jgi:septum formation protein
MTSPPPRLILASASAYRAEMLRRLRLPFEQQAADVDERPQLQETPDAQAQRLAAEKAKRVAAMQKGAWVLGSDQVASCGPQRLGKPGSPAGAAQQLRQISGQSVTFYTAVALVSNDQLRRALDITTVRVRNLKESEIERYLAAEPAHDCAGSFKCEGLGITLFDAVETVDPTALVGLPLIATRKLLAEAGWLLP